MSVPRIRTKLCGMMTAADARAAADAGADAIGMILHADARRLIDFDTAHVIVKALPPYVAAVGVFLDAETSLVKDFAKRLHLAAVQFHGSESAEQIKAVGAIKVIKSIKVVPDTIRATLDTWKTFYRNGLCNNLIGILLETPVAGAAGGTGVANDFVLIKQLIDEKAFEGLPPVIVSGGLTPENAGDVARLLKPYALDVSSGIESSYGKKSVEKMIAFVKNASS